jgi:hypothetical protein
MKKIFILLCTVLFFISLNINQANANFIVSFEASKHVTGKSGSNGNSGNGTKTPNGNGQDKTSQGEKDKEKVKEGESSSGSSGSNKGAGNTNKIGAQFAKEFWREATGGGSSSSQLITSWQKSGDLKFKKSSYEKTKETKTLWYDWTFENLTDKSVPKKTRPKEGRTITELFEHVGRWRIEATPQRRITTQQMTVTEVYLYGYLVERNYEAGAIKHKDFKGPKDIFFFVATEPGPVQFPLPELEKPKTCPELVK